MIHHQHFNLPCLVATHLYQLDSSHNPFNSHVPLHCSFRVHLGPFDAYRRFTRLRIRKLSGARDILCRGMFFLRSIHYHHPDSASRPQFDKFNASVRVPDGYDGMLWNGFTTVDPVKTYGIQAPKGPGALAIQAPNFEGSSIAIQSGLGELYSFYFACSGRRNGFSGRLPEVCSLQVVAVENFGPNSISAYGPFTSSVNYTAVQNRLPAEMTKVTVNATGSTFYLYLTAGSSDSVLLLSNLYYEVQC